LAQMFDQASSATRRRDDEPWHHVPHGKTRMAGNCCGQDRERAWSSGLRERSAAAL